MKDISRRSFLRLCATSAFAFGCSSILKSCAGSSRKDMVMSGPDRISEINATVAAVKGKNLYSITRDAIAAIGGMESVVNEGEIVFIKGNFIVPYPKGFLNGECTKPEVLIAIAEECLEAGAREVIIGDGSQYFTFPWKHMCTLDQKTDLVTEVTRLNAQYGDRISLACLETDYPCQYRVPSKIRPSGSLLVSTIYEKADKIISVPVAKTHFCAQLTLGLKNFMGVLSIAEYGSDMGTYWDRGIVRKNPRAIVHTNLRKLCQVFLDVVAAKKPDLTIIDFSIGMEKNGPSTGSGGKPVNVKDRLGGWLVLASRDIMAADATAARVMGHHVPDIKQLTMGYEMGLGEIHRESIEIIGEPLSSIEMKWKPAVLIRQIGKTPGRSPVTGQILHT
jgi:uncharacterized protein (DUF362 family)